ncbi:Chitinase-like protein Idgf3 [Lucilia cuprina]|uniref:Chitinase-like protein Idgf3 n=1 Tax=Lucilia cuprina TaxID=7375 RepID=A0A0L0CHK4_LUCCU|nr:Chitinase-like protein Idgf3 [Lucilia cuprina]KNC31731.1 Chitinase-like protein Idgf3 [Lucilia cuprina]
MKKLQDFVGVAVILLGTFLKWSQAIKLVCYYDMSSASRVGRAKFTSQDMEFALNFCTHVIYSYVTITPDKLVLTAQMPEKQQELANMKNFKNKYPNVKFLLSISGENNDKTIKSFLQLLEDRQATKILIKSLMDVLIKYKFDGLSLDFPLPTVLPTEPVRIKIWKYFINLFKIHHFDTDPKYMEHKDQLTILIQLLKAHFNERNLMLTLNVLPNVDSKKYFEIPEIINYLDFVILSAFDFFTPQRNPLEANFMSPTKALKSTTLQRNSDLSLGNIKDFYKFWHSQKVPRHKIVVGVAAYGRSWKMTKNSNSNGIPPVYYTDGPATAGPQTYTPGFLSYPEICEKLRDFQLKSVTDPKAKSGVYAFRPADSNGNFGIWISYENYITAGAKADYVRNHNLGGVALIDLSLDDIHGECNCEKFPILKSIRLRLTKIFS